MSDHVLERLAAANPVPAAARSWVAAELSLAERAPTAVSRRRRRVGGRTAVAAAAAVLTLAAVALVSVAAAFGLQIGPIDFANAEHAPPRVVQDFATLTTGAPPGMDPAAIASEARKVVLPDGHNVLWIAPTRYGGYCAMLNGSGGCESRGAVPLNVTWHGGPASPGSSVSANAVDGALQSRYADGVDIHLSSGEVVHPSDIVWISPPIHAGFFVYYAPHGEFVRKVVATKNGRPVAEDDTGSPAQEKQVPPRFTEVDKRSAAVSVDTTAGRATLWTAPTPTDQECAWLEFGTVRRNLGDACLPKAYKGTGDQGIALAEARNGDAKVLYGVASARYARELLLEFSDGTTLVVRPNDGYVLAAFPHPDTEVTVRVRGPDGAFDPHLQMRLPAAGG